MLKECLIQKRKNKNDIEMKINMLKLISTTMLKNNPR